MKDPGGRAPPDSGPGCPELSRVSPSPAPAPGIHRVGERAPRKMERLRARRAHKALYPGLAPAPLSLRPVGGAESADGHQSPGLPGEPRPFPKPLTWPQPTGITTESAEAHSASRLARADSALFFLWGLSRAGRTQPRGRRRPPRPRTQASLEPRIRPRLAGRVPGVLPKLQTPPLPQPEVEASLLGNLGQR